MKPFIIPLFIPNYGCPKRCVYCDQNISVGQRSFPTPLEISNIVETHLNSASLYPTSSRHVQVAFYGGTFTGLPFSKQKKYLKAITPYIKKKQVDSIRLSTRPDYINQNNINLLKSFQVKTIEIGVQSMDNEVLKLSQRGYTAQTVNDATSLIKKNGMELGIQLMPGLPGDTKEKIMKTSYQICRIKPDFLRIYPAIVIKGTLLENLYLKGVYKPLSLHRAISICKKMLALFQSANVPVIRMGIQPTETLLEPGVIVSGPFHPAFRQLVLSSIYFDRLNSFLKERGSLKQTSVAFSIHPSELSTFIGNKKDNLTKLQKDFPHLDIQFNPDLRTPRGEFKVITK